ncbi:MAG: hypothetical protein ABS939_17150 [Psychrobacillus sp.]
MEKRYAVTITVDVVADTEQGAINEAIYKIEKSNSYDVAVEEENE